MTSCALSDGHADYTSLRQDTLDDAVPIVGFPFAGLPRLNSSCPWPRNGPYTGPHKSSSWSDRGRVTPDHSGSLL